MQRTGVYATGGVLQNNGIRWSADAGAAIASVPVAAEGSIFVVTRNGLVIAFDASSGQVRWRFTPEDPVSSSAVQYASPTVVSGTVYIGSNDTNIYALDAATGNRRWKFKTGGEIFSSAAVNNNVVYAGSDDGNLYALDAATGRERWKFVTGNKINSAQSLSGNTVYVHSYDNTLYALDVAGGERRWAFKTEPGQELAALLLSTAAVGDDGRIYAGSDGGYAYALDSRTGQQIWRTRIGSGPTSSPALFAGTLYIQNTAGQVVALDSASGQLRWVYPAASQRIYNSGIVPPSPVLAAGLVYAAAGRNLVILDRDGKQQWSYALGEPAIAGPVLADGTVYVAAGSKITALR